MPSKKNEIEIVTSKKTIKIDPDNPFQRYIRIIPGEDHKYTVLFSKIPGKGYGEVPSWADGVDLSSYSDKREIRFKKSNPPLGYNKFSLDGGTYICDLIEGGNWGKFVRGNGNAGIEYFSKKPGSNRNSIRIPGNAKSIETIDPYKPRVTLTINRGDGTSIDKTVNFHQ